MISNVQDLRRLSLTKSSQGNSDIGISIDSLNFYRQTLFLSTKYLFRQEFCNQNDNDNKSLHEREITTRNPFILRIYRR